MKIMIFCGPTISTDEVRKILPDALTLPPVSQGDVYLAVQEEPSAIGIIDGYFHQVPSVWHKEIMWALYKGVRVYGAASMGALRAAELHTLGMIGVGKIFEDYKSGAIEDDDEVAVIHGPPETGFIACSDAMVDIRRTLRAAAEDGVISPLLANRLITRAKMLHYAQRSFDGILHKDPMAPATLQRLKSWLKDGRIWQKKDDAIELCCAIQQGRGLTSPHPSILHFEETLHWQQLTKRLDGVL